MGKSEFYGWYSASSGVETLEQQEAEWVARLNWTLSMPPGGVLGLGSGPQRWHRLHGAARHGQRLVPLPTSRRTRRKQRRE
jgi:hypothetical protein